MAKASRSTIAKKAWVTRRANAKKRGVKPGTKRGPYKKVRAKHQNKIIKGLKEAVIMASANGSMKVGDRVTFASVGNLPSLISDLTSTIDTLEAQLTAQIDRIKSILV